MKGYIIIVLVGILNFSELIILKNKKPNHIDTNFNKFIIHL